MRNFYFLLLGLCLFTSVNAQVINIPDANFKAKLLAASLVNDIARNINGYNIKIDSNSDGEIEVSEALLIYSLNVSNSSIIDMTGIQSFAELQFLDCSNNQITSLEINGLSNLYRIDCNYNKINNLKLSGLHDRMLLSCSNNKLTSLDLSSFTTMESLDCNHNFLTTLDLPYISGDGINVSYNLLETLEVKGKPFGLVYDLDYFNCSNNPNLKILLLKNAIIYSMQPSSGYFDSTKFSNCPNLKYVCVRDDDFINMKKIITQNKYTKCEVNTYCSFNPGGNFYTIQGTTKIDDNNNGCDESDEIYPNLKFSITDGTTIGGFISNTSSNYSIPVQVGTHTITPVLENPTYFTVFPTDKMVTFPAEISPYTQDFCITPNGNHPDLEITVLPIGAASPGFDAKYKIIYKNKGNTTQSGSVNFAFNDAVLDLVAANPTTNQQPSVLTWDFTDLLPFETREIALTLNTNSPIETPAVNNGDILNYTATISSANTDETPNDNTFTLHQTVVGSFDPNDKTCLEGKTITPEMIGREVHYMIRFENTGTFAAQNIVVKDLIDTDKFDISSLVPIRGSHEFVTRITENNKVEFIFENINLPFEDANNDGFVVFKIKTKPTLKTGDSFSNTASIYFDYNAPIVTNTATTTIAVLEKQDFEFSNYFSLYPNPASTVLNLNLKNEIEVSSINIYNTLGQVVLIIPNAKQVKTVDVSGLSRGNYFIKLNTDKGSSVEQFIKK